MGAVRFLLVVVCAVALNGLRVPGSGVVRDAGGSERRSQQMRFRLQAGDKGGAGAVIRAAQKEVGVRETGQNAGKRVDEYNACVGFKGVPWCASFVSFCFKEAGYREPRTAWSPALFPAGRSVQVSAEGQVKGVSKHGSRDLSCRRDDGESLRDIFLSRDDEGVKGLVFGIYFSELKRIGHCGFVEEVKGDWVQTIEGNTSPDGGREGIGVFRRLRHKRGIAKYADWL